jgi:LCP family protein required for cell wall assembly
VTLPASLAPFLRRFAIACLVVAVLTGATIVASNSYERKKFAESRTVHVPNVVPAKPGEPANYLLIGSDTRAIPGFNENEAPGARSDVMMVLHVDPRNRTGMLVSFPRDLVVLLPNGNHGLLNSAFDLYGDKRGPETVIRTLETNFPPLRINHYLEVDFDGFRNIVNAIGRVKLWFPTPVHDPYSGLDVEQAGCVSLDGDGALAYARSRHYYIPRDVANPAPWQWNADPNLSPNADRGGHGWLEDPLEDLDRIPRQQYFLRTLAREAIDKTAGNPTKLFGLLDAVKNSFAHDDQLKFDELKALIRTFNRLDPVRVDMETLPVAAATGRWLGHVVATDGAINTVERLMFWDKTSPPLPQLLAPNQVNVKLVDGSGVPGLADTALAQFEAAGFRVTNGGAADRSTYDRTQIRYAPDKFAEGFTAATAVSTINLLPAIDAQNTLGADVLVVIGRDYNALPHRFPGTAVAPTSTTAPVQDTTTTAAAPPTTQEKPTPPQQVNSKYVPVDPKNRGPLVGCP